MWTFDDIWTCKGSKADPKGQVAWITDHMSSAVAAALEKAAQRASRVAALDAARVPQVDANLPDVQLSYTLVHTLMNNNFDM